jgi:hypothetical protein
MHFLRHLFELQQTVDEDSGDWPWRTSLNPFLLSVNEEGKAKLTILKYSDYGVIISILFHVRCLRGQGNKKSLHVKLKFMPCCPAPVTSKFSVATHNCRAEVWPEQ